MAVVFIIESTGLETIKFITLSLKKGVGLSVSVC